MAAAGFLVGACTFAGLAGLGIAALHLRAAAEAPRAVVAPVHVETVKARLEDGYTRVVSYTGRLEAARQTALAFERSGLVMVVAKDEGQPVRQGEVVARLDTSQLQATRRQLEARRRELEAQRNLASLTLGRQWRLKTQGWSPEQRLDEAEATVAQLTAAIEQVGAQIAGLDIDFAKSELRAPFDGRVAARNIDEGAVVAAGTQVLTLLENGRRQARIGVPPDVAEKLDAQKLLRVDVQGRSFNAKLAARRPDLETGTRTVTVLLDIDDGSGSSVLGELASLAVEAMVPERGAWMPLTTLREGRRGLWTVLVVDRTDTGAIVRGEAVEVLHVEAARAFVRGTFRDGDAIIAHGTDRVVVGQRIALGGE
jgi:RND family efflux transporter MFP subunit